MTKKCTISNEMINSIINTYGSPVQIYDGNQLEQRCLNFISAFESSGFKFGTNFMQYFAVKATPNPHILNLMYKLGFGFDCSSLTEVYLVEKCIEPIEGKEKKIMYSSNYTSIEDFIEILPKKNIIVNLDDYDGFMNLISAYRKINIDKYDKGGLFFNNIEDISDMVDTICFRYNPMFGETDSETISNILGGENSKFGMSEDRIIEAYSAAKVCGVKNFGIHIMTGSNVMNASYWNKLIKIAIDLVETLSYQLNIKISFIDIGGGFGISYRPDQPELDMYQVAKNIRKSLDNTFCEWDISLFTESGRYITGPIGYLVATCKSIKSDNDQIYYGLDANMSNLMRPGMYGSYHHITVPRVENEFYTTLCNIVGTLCENNDWFARSRELPTGIQKNDIFVIHDTGAHGHSMGFQYNGKLRACEVLCFPSQNKYNLVRRRDTIDDIVSVY